MLTLVIALTMIAPTDYCDAEMEALGFCSNDGESVGVGFGSTGPGLGGGGDGDNDFWEYGEGGGSGDPAVGRGDAHRCSVLGPEGPGCTYVPDDPDDPLPPITLWDVAYFTPTPPAISVDPAGVAVMNLPTNFVSEAGEQVFDAEILGRWVTVLFTPIEFAFETGDGAVVTSDHGGVSWEVSGLPQFTPTDTSHVYRERGLVYPSVTVTYGASVDVGTGWIWLGTVSSTGPAREIQVYEAVTRLIKPEP